MRRRIVLTNVLLTVGALLFFGLIVVSASAYRVVHTQRDFATIDANRIALAVDSRVAHGESLSPDSLAGVVRADASAEIRLPDGQVLTLGTRTPAEQVTAQSTVPGRATVVVHTAGDSFGSALLRIGAVLLIIGLLVVLVAALVARRLANSLVEPVQDLALVAARLGTGDPRPARRRYGIGELDAVAEVLDASAQRIGEQLAVERQLAADVSHQLRTPLTALSMRLEEVLATDDPAVARSEATVALQQVERLSGVVDSLLEFSRHTVGTKADVDIDAVLTQQLDEWRGAFAAQDRSVQIGGTPDLVAWVSANALGQIVATLLENALLHGGGATTVRTRTSGSSVVIEVSDDGSGVPAGLVRHIFDRDVSGASRSGLGLSLARALMEAEGGRIELIHAKPATFAVFLPVAPERAAEPTAAPPVASAPGQKPEHEGQLTAQG